MSTSGEHEGAKAVAVGQRLAEVLGVRCAGAPRRLSGGASRETWALRVAGPDGQERDLIAQLDRGAPAVLDQPDPALQGPLLHAAAAAGVPVPAVVAQGGPDPVLGPAWLVVERLPGEADPAWILGPEGPQPGQLLDQIAAAAASVHRMPIEPALGLAEPDPVESLRRTHEALARPHPVFDLALRRLDASRPPRRGRAVLHGDLRIGNLLADDEGLTGVLDWELARVGDPVEDLGWLCVRAWRFQRPDRGAGGIGSRADLLEAYARRSGVSVDPAELRWWELLGTVRWGVICVLQAAAGDDGTPSSLEHALIGRRACQVEWDVLDLLEPGEHEAVSSAAAGSPPATATPPGDGPAERSALDRDHTGPPRPADQRPPHDDPRAETLLRSVGAALTDDVLPAVDGRAAFQVRVARRTLAVVAREIAASDDHRARHARALAALGAGDEGELAAVVRRGALDDPRPEELGALRETVRIKLEAADPRHLRPVHDPEVFS